jgi:hypothetical protein
VIAAFRAAFADGQVRQLGAAEVHVAEAVGGLEPRAPSDTTTISGFGCPRSASAAKRRARGKSARVSVGLTRVRAASRSATSPVIVESGVTGVHLRDEHAIGAGEPAHELLHLLLGDLDAARRDVGRLHAGARVEQHDDAAPFDQRGRRARIAEGEQEQGEQRELEQQREALELREEAGGLLVAQDAVPEAREGHGDGPPPQLQDVEKNDDRGRGGAERQQRREGQANELHG